jgi:tetratricopeptide (TPR) repeat protein
VLFAALVPLNGSKAHSLEAEFKRVSALFQQGNLTNSQELAAHAAAAFQFASPAWAARFTVLEAEAAAWRGLNTEVLRLLSPPLQSDDSPELAIKRLSLLGLAHARMQQFNEADQTFAQAQRACSVAEIEACGELLRARGGMATGRGQYKDAHQLYSLSLASARRFGQRWDESVALMNLGSICLMEDRFDEAIGLLHDAEQIAAKLNAGDVLVTTLGNLGWAYYRIGDAESALEMFREAERRSVILGDSEDAITWLTTSGVVYEDSRELARAAAFYRQALDLAKQINSNEDVVTSLELLAHLSIDAGSLNEADVYIDQLSSMVQADGNRLDALDVTLAKAKIASRRRQDKIAERLLRTVEHDPASLAYMRLDAEHEIATLFELQGKTADADRMYRTALTTFGSSWGQLKEETSRLPFLANATRIYDDYIQFLIKQGKHEEALLTADQSRARTLAQGLDLTRPRQPVGHASFSPRAVARKTGTTLLFYWLGERQSYLWAITPDRIALFPLPPEKELSPLIEHYRVTLLDLQDTTGTANGNGETLFRLLVAPALKLIPSKTPVMILADGVLSRLNFETLLVPGPSPFPEPGPRPASNPDSGPSAHYWIDDAIVLSAPSLAMLAAAKPRWEEDRSLLLFGNPVSPSPDFPSLPYFGFEMAEVEKHFAVNRQAVFTGQEANPANYLSSDPARYSYIHFVTHAVASRADPLDSAIILSGGPAGENSFKLYARDIMQHPIRARLVTISACYGSGTRAYAGEGMVGLAWAFLRAGARNTIGALWEVSDDSTARLMDTLYKGIQEGQPPAVALRRGKLDLLHSKTRFRRPFYWAPFQIYTR